MNKVDCPITNSLKLIGGKWKIAITYNLRKGPLRFGELKRALSPITQQMLTCLLYTSPSPRDRQKSRMPSSA